MHRIIRLVLLVILVIIIVVVVLPRARGIGETDFLVYWSAAHLLANGENPYDPATLQALQHETRPERVHAQEQALGAWNLPWLLVILLPFGLLPFAVAAPVWMLCNIALTVLAALCAWRLLTRGVERRDILIAVATSLFFVQSLVSIRMGQIVSLLLIGLVLGVRWLHAGRDRLAGAALLLATIKPHLTYFFFLALLLWVIRHRQWQVFQGTLVTAILSALILWLIFPGWVSAYVKLVSSHAFFQYSTSTVGGLAYALWGTNLLRFAGILLLPFAFHIVRLADTQGWLTAMNVALLLSLPLAPYGFSFDQTLLIPAILQVIVWLWQRELSQRWTWLIGTGLMIVNVVLFIILIQPVTYYHYFTWTPLALGGLYALAWRQRRRTSEAN